MKSANTIALNTYVFAVIPENPDCLFAHPVVKKTAMNIPKVLSKSVDVSPNCIYHT